MLSWQKPTLTFTELQQDTGLSKDSLSKHLWDLVSIRALEKRRVGKNSLYTARSEADFHQRLVFYGPRKRPQFLKALRLGLDPMYVKKRRGLAKRKLLSRLKKDRQLDAELLTKVLSELRYIEKYSGLRSRESFDNFLLSYRGRDVGSRRKLVPRAKRHSREPVKTKKLPRTSPPIGRSYCKACGLELSLSADKCDECGQSAIWEP